MSARLPLAAAVATEDEEDDGGDGDDDDGDDDDGDDVNDDDIPLITWQLMEAFCRNKCLSWMLY